MIQILCYNVKQYDNCIQIVIRGRRDMQYLIIVLLLVIVIESISILWLTGNIKNEKKIQDTIQFFRSFWGKFVFYVLATSIIGLFLGSIYFKSEIELETINSWVSIVLGLVALIIGIISLFLSFYNLDEGNRNNKESVEIMQDIKMEFMKQIGDMRKDILHKIEESSQETQNIIQKGEYKASTNNSFQQPQGDNTWENIKVVRENEEKK